QCRLPRARRADDIDVTAAVVAPDANRPSVTAKPYSAQHHAPLFCSAVEDVRRFKFRKVIHLHPLRGHRRRRWMPERRQLLVAEEKPATPRPMSKSAANAPQ